MRCFCLFVPTFLCSEAVLGLSGVVFMLAGVAATGEEEVFSIISAGIFLSEISHKTTNYDPRVKEKGLSFCPLSCRKNPEVCIKLKSV